MNTVLEPVKRRVIFIAIICFLLAVSLGFRFYHVQIVRHDELLAKATKIYTADQVKMRQRGRIFDAEGHLLVGNLPMIYIECSPYSVVDEPFIHLEKSLKKGDRERLPMLRERRRQRVARLLATHFDVDEKEIYAKLAPWREIVDSKGNVKKVKSQYLVVAEKADPKRVDDFKKAMAAADLHLGGFKFEDIYIRFYPKGTLLANVLGLAKTGKELNAEHGGLESAIGKDLRAEDARGTYQRDGNGEILGNGEKHVEVAGHDGDDFYLTVREPIQSILEEELDKAYAEHNPGFIYAVIVDPRSGDILAISQRPNFDPNDDKSIVASIRGKYFSNAVSGNAYEPGSVMKPFFIAKALDEGIIDTSTEIDGGTSGSWHYYGTNLSDFRGYGMMTPAMILKKSSNIGTAKVALLMGDNMVWQTLKDFRFDQSSGLPFWGESRGVRPRFPFRDKVTVTRVPIGYAEQVTALQLARAYSTIANGGYMPELRIIDRRQDTDGKVTDFPRKPKKKVLKSANTFALVRDMLVGVTEKDGTGRRARIPGYVVAGKTGTSEMVINGNPRSGWYRATFCGFVPAYNPELVMVVTCEKLHKSKDHGGGNVAAPIFQRTMSRVLKFMNVTPDNPDELERDAAKAR